MLAFRFHSNFEIVRRNVCRRNPKQKILRVLTFNFEFGDKYTSTEQRFHLLIITRFYICLWIMRATAVNMNFNHNKLKFKQNVSS